MLFLVFELPNRFIASRSRHAAVVFKCPESREFSPQPAERLHPLAEDQRLLATGVDLLEIGLQALLQGIFAAIISGIGFMKMVQVFGPVKAPMLTAVVPAITAASAVLWLDEPFTWMLGAGLVCVTLGIAVGVGRSAQPPRAQPTQAG